MIDTLKLENYRGFEKYKLRELSMVNLLVGPNNCGKTSVLEAVHLLVSQGDPDVLVKSSQRRSESYAVEEQSPDTPHVLHYRYPLHHHFHGHRLEPGVRLSVSTGAELGQVQIYIVEDEPDDAPDLFPDFSEAARPLALLVQTGSSKGEIRFPLTEDGSLDWRFRRVRRRSASRRPKPPPTEFVTAESLNSRDMAESWNQVNREGREAEVVEAMRILQRDLKSIYFPTGASSRGGLGGVLLGFRGGNPRVPIGSYGDGMRRLLALSLSLVRATDGFLLIDEIDTGLHWTVLEEMWKLVIDAAISSSIQVFATTHSLDCINGLATVLKKRQDLEKKVSVQKIERQLDHSVSFGAVDIVKAADLSIEMR
ncbi:MAG: AAA family ATPase [Bacteroidota bacterium]|nr:AAA family ATPase [Bacteroidota bacterium]